MVGLLKIRNIGVVVGRKIAPIDVVGDSSQHGGGKNEGGHWITDDRFYITS